jgi:tRNA threonylcarbamoyladenosine modification (KEOPS) complex Cgi121 subunit
MISKSLWNEILLYVSLQRQVHKAFDLVGVKNYSGTVVKVERGNGQRRTPEISESQEKKNFWGVKSTEELLEKMAVFHVDNY